MLAVIAASVSVTVSLIAGLNTEVAVMIALTGTALTAPEGSTARTNTWVFAPAATGPVSGMLSPLLSTSGVTPSAR